MSFSEDNINNIEYNSEYVLKQWYRRIRESQFGHNSAYFRYKRPYKLCWHNLSIVEKNIENGDDEKTVKHMEKSDIFYEKMVSVYEENKSCLFQNMSDTAAWYCHLKSKYIHKFKPKEMSSRKRNKEIYFWKNKAVKWAEEIIKDHMENRGTNPLRSINLHQQHIQTILEEKENMMKNTD